MDGWTDGQMDGQGQKGRQTKAIPIIPSPLSGGGLITNCKLQTRIPRKASSHLLAQKSQEPQSECGY